MKFLPLLFLPLLGCETYPYPELSYNELYQQASDCRSAKAIGCDPLWAEVERRDVSRDKREAKIEQRERERLECAPGAWCIDDEEDIRRILDDLNRRQNRGWGR